MYDQTRLEPTRCVHPCSCVYVCVCMCAAVTRTNPPNAVRYGPRPAPRVFAAYYAIAMACVYVPERIHVCTKHGGIWYTVPCNTYGTYIKPPHTYIHTHTGGVCDPLIHASARLAFAYITDNCTARLVGGAHVCVTHVNGLISAHLCAARTNKKEKETDRDIYARIYGASGGRDRESAAVFFLHTHRHTHARVCIAATTR